jgi:hypothetical protein
MGGEVAHHWQKGDFLEGLRPSKPPAWRQNADE